MKTFREVRKRYHVKFNFFFHGFLKIFNVLLLFLTTSENNFILIL